MGLKTLPGIFINRGENENIMVARFLTVTRLYKREDLTEAETDNQPARMDWYKRYSHLLDWENVKYVERAAILDKNCTTVEYENESVMIDKPYKEMEKMCVEYKTQQTNIWNLIKNQ